MNARRVSTPSSLLIILAALAAVTCAVAVQFAVHPLVPNEFGWLVLDACVGISFAGCAVVAQLTFGRTTLALMMLVVALTWSAPTFGIVLQPTSSLWPAFWALQGIADVLIVAMALGSAVAEHAAVRVMLVAAFSTTGAAIVIRLLTYDPGTWGWCACLANPFALSTEPVFLALLSAGLAIHAALAIVFAVLVAQRGEHGRLVAVAFAAVAGAWVLFDAVRGLGIPATGGGPIYLRLAAMAAFPILVLAALAADSSRQRLLDSRRRIVLAEDSARRRIERDLHDGVQQLLVSASINLGRARAGDADASGALDRIEDQLGQAIVELRELARGLSPTALARGGIRGALEELAMHSPLPVDVTVEGDDALADSASSTVYFIVAEAVTNALRHSDARRVTVAVHVIGGRLTATVSDDGTGGAVPTHDGGLRGLIDRAEALGGSLTIDSPSGGGTRLELTLPDVGGR